MGKEDESALAALFAMVRHAFTVSDARLDYEDETLERARQLAERSERFKTQGLLQRMAERIRRDEDSRRSE